MTQEQIKALTIVLEIAEYHWDEGPEDEGWQSNKLTNACSVVRKMLDEARGTPESFRFEEGK